LSSRIRSEDGQVIALVAICLVVLLGFAALAIDVGNAYFSQRKLQASADAAALAGAQGLPNGDHAVALAQQYSGDSGGKNATNGFEDVHADVTLECAPVTSGCSTLNTVRVVEQAHVKSFFAKVLGIDHFGIKVHAAACLQATQVHLIDDNGPCPAAVGFSVQQRLKPANHSTVTPNGGGPMPTGNVVFQLFGPADPTCNGTPAFTDTEPLSGGEAAAVNTSFLASIPGSWRWKVHYGGDVHYGPLDSSCGSENVSISNN
jgi:hypothetical protein